MAFGEFGPGAIMVPVTVIGGAQTHETLKHLPYTCIRSLRDNDRIEFEYNGEFFCLEARQQLQAPKTFGKTISELQKKILRLTPI